MNRYDEDNADLLHDQRSQEELERRQAISRRVAQWLWQQASPQGRAEFVDALLRAWESSDLKVGQAIERKYEEIVRITGK